MNRIMNEFFTQYYNIFVSVYLTLLDMDDFHGLD